MNNEIKEILDYLDYGVNSLSISKPPFKIEYEDIKKLLDYINDLEQQCKKQKEVIDKAIEYLEEPNRDSFDYSKALLLEILLGENNE